MSQIVARYSSLDHVKQACFNLQLAHWLTIYARSPEFDRKQLGHINELQHRLIGQSIHLLKGDGDQCPSDEFLALIEAGFEDLSLSAENIFQSVWDRG